MDTVSTDEAIEQGLRLRSLDLIEDLARHERRAMRLIADDMRDVVPCSDDEFRRALYERYELDPERDEDLALANRILSKIWKYEDEDHDAPFLVTFRDPERLAGCEIVDRRLIPLAPTRNLKPLRTLRRSIIRPIWMLP